MYISNDILLLPICFFIIYFILESVDWGLCISSAFISRSDDERQSLIELFKPGIDGNELWFLIGIVIIFLSIDLLHEYTYDLKILTFLVLLGAVLRFIFARFSKKFKSLILNKILGIISIISLIFLGLYAYVALSNEYTLVSISGMFSALWFILSSFQVGCLYGAVKTSNPLSERLRASFLVSSILSVVVYLIFGVLLKFYNDGIFIDTGYYWVGILSTIIFSFIAFYFARTRNIKVALVFSYFSLLFSFSAYVVAYISKFYSLKISNIIIFKSTLTDLHIVEVLLFTVVVTFCSFVYKFMRKKIVYKWKDGI